MVPTPRRMSNSPGANAQALVAQSAFPEELQGEISGLSRSVSSLGSSLGTAVAGTVLISGLTTSPNRPDGVAMGALAGFAAIGLGVTRFLPPEQANSTADPIEPRGHRAPRPPN